MTLRYLLDTNVISEPLRPEPHPAVMARLQEYGGMSAIASVVWHELLYGVERRCSSAPLFFPYYGASCHSKTSSGSSRPFSLLS
ncbi:MAG: PIN domain-containing protein [Candidatus Viridilinea halotolerans]|uniref:PIN domain-containing protein n=1 Tax=Candidatus Viridilinea halotolerans TaxID=2491704 RepID=A0A426TZL7_9CHLR|nr:MAG: PIN domain-containing protein [Candidatus Viridilinea halotolerans]